MKITWVLLDERIAENFFSPQIWGIKFAWPLVRDESLQTGRCHHVGLVQYGFINALSILAEPRTTMSLCKWEKWWDMTIWPTVMLFLSAWCTTSACRAGKTHGQDSNKISSMPDFCFYFFFIWIYKRPEIPKVILLAEITLAWMLYWSYC